MRYLPDDNLAYPVLIKLDTDRYGSGFFLRSKNSLYLVTAKHVFLNSTDGKFLCNKEFSITAYSRDLLVKEPILISVQLDSVRDEFKKHTSSDVIVMRMGDIRYEHEANLDRAFFLPGIKITACPIGASIVWVDEKLFKKYNDIFISNDIFVLGYPVSIGHRNYEQIDIMKPLLRKGIIAGKNERKRTIILDSPVYFGNSGGLVLEVDLIGGEPRFLPIGVVSEYVPFIEELYSLQHKEVVSINRANSGYSVAVPIDNIIDLI